jgi:hypothetical protein
MSPPTSTAVSPSERYVHEISQRIEDYDTIESLEQTESHYIHTFLEPKKNKKLKMFPFVLQNFGIYMIKDKDNVTLKDVLLPGKKMVDAGYCMYGSSCTVIRPS